jgi:hypothetical protein
MNPTGALATATLLTAFAIPAVVMNTHRRAAQAIPATLAVFFAAAVLCLLPVYTATLGAFLWLLGALLWVYAAVAIPV